MQKYVSAGGGILAFEFRARDFWTLGAWHLCSPDYESGAQTRLGYPGCLASVILTTKGQIKAFCLTVSFSGQSF